ncbi:restriction endonuclease subunit S [uncultured Lamprocystis sp.]|uniref:restriction endonuclease subunit S n=1 Tax=uncultured Lamprocystis sp. TaxID=543132 RepID=UPI0025D09625|nr:restriction endonuclease subunit S [uncultured Lamprocystis sp.]
MFHEESFLHYPLPLSSLPRGWEYVSLADIAIDVNPGFASGEHNSNGSGIPHLRPMNIDRNGKINVSIIKSVAATRGRVLTAGDVLFNNTNSPELVGKTALISLREQGYAFSNHMTRLRLERHVETAFVAHQLHFFWMSGYSRHRCTNHVNQASISSNTLISTIPLVLPPAKEQRRIVEKLEEILSDLDIGVTELTAARKKLEQYRQSLLKAAVDGTLTASWREVQLQQQSEPEETGAQLLERILTGRRARWEAKQLAKFAERGRTPPKGWQSKYPEPIRPDIANLSKLPERWVWASLDQLTEFITTGSRGWADYYASDGALFIRSQNINKDRLDLSDVAFVNPPCNSEGARTRVKQDDLLLTVTGANVGKAARVDVELEEAYVSQHVALMRPMDAALSGYLHLFLTAVGGGRGQLEKDAYGAGKPGLNLQQLGAVAIPIPAREEVGALMDVVSLQLSAATQQEQSVGFTLKRAAAQRQNILKAAFSGQLVPQDPNDEPASVLLERIRAERAAAGADVGKRGTRNPRTVMKRSKPVVPASSAPTSAAGDVRRCDCLGTIETIDP